MYTYNLYKKGKTTMNKLQLQYIKEQQKLNIITLPSIQMRRIINNSIIDELDTIYNPNLLGAETEFKSSLADVSLSHDFLDDTRMITIIRNHGAEAVLIYMFIHAKMCHEGYKLEWNAMQEDVYSATLQGVYKLSIDNFKKILHVLVENHLFFIIKDSNNKNWLTSAYQIYMYERVSAKRVRDRIYKKNQSLDANDKIKVSSTLPAIEDTDEGTATSEDSNSIDPIWGDFISEDYLDAPTTPSFMDTTLDDDNHNYF